MQRERLSISKAVLYILFTLVFYALQSSLFGTWSFQGYHLDLMPALVVAAALLDGPMEGAVTGVAVGVFYDLGFVGTDGLYPVFFMLFGLIIGSLSRLTLSRSYISMMLLNAVEMVLLGLVRYFGYLLPRKGASFPLVMQQIAGGTLLACAFCFVVYLPMRKISRRFSS